MPKKPVKKSTKSRILDVMMKLFNEKGYANTSINEVCRRAKVSKGALYHHFKSKEDLLFTFMDKFFEDYYNEMASLMQKAKSPSDHIRIMIDISFKFINPEKVNPVFWLSLLNEGKNIKGRIAEYFDNVYFGFRTELKKLITQGKKSGEFRKDLDSNTIAVIITGVIEGIGIQLLFDTKNCLKLNSIKKKTTDYILEMLEVKR
jgi:TetR/AcrR family fatty acid metabolism transcriptional regulator